MNVRLIYLLLLVLTLSTTYAVEPHLVVTKKVVFFGDSIAGNDTGGGLHTRYPEVVSELIGLDHTNVAMGGNRLAAHRNANRTLLSMFNLSKAIKSGDWSDQEAAALALVRAQYWIDFRDEVAELQAIDWSQVDLVVISFGANDFRGNVPLDEFAQAIDITINNIISGYPDLRIVFTTPIYSSREGGSHMEQNRLGLYLQDYVSMIVSRCHRGSIPVIDLFSRGGINASNSSVFLKSDGVHPNVEGSAFLAHSVARELNQLINYY